MFISWGLFHADGSWLKTGYQLRRETADYRRDFPARDSRGEGSSSSGGSRFAAEAVCSNATTPGTGNPGTMMSRRFPAINGRVAYVVPLEQDVQKHRGGAQKARVQVLPLHQAGHGVPCPHRRGPTTAKTTLDAQRVGRNNDGGPYHPTRCFWCCGSSR